MTTIIYKNGVVYADSQITTIDKDENIIGKSKARKVHRIGKKVIAEVGCNKICDIYFAGCISSLVMRLFKKEILICNYPITLTAVIVEIDKKTYRTFAITPRQFRLTKNWYFTLFNVKVKAHKLKNVVWDSLGSGSKFTEEYLKKGLHPIEIIKLVSVKDEYTNDQIDSIKI